MSSHHQIYQTLSHHARQESAAATERMKQHAYRGDWQNAAREHGNVSRLHQEQRQLLNEHKRAVIKHLAGGK